MNLRENKEVVYDRGWERKWKGEMILIIFKFQKIKNY